MRLDESPAQRAFHSTQKQVQLSSGAFGEVSDDVGFDVLAPMQL